MARYLQVADQAVQVTVAAPGVVVDTQVLEARQGDEDLLGQHLQVVVLQQQCGQSVEAGEGALLDHVDLVLLQVQAL